MAFFCTLRVKGYSGQVGVMGLKTPKIMNWELCLSEIKYLLSSGSSSSSRGEQLSASKLSDELFIAIFLGL